MDFHRGILPYKQEDNMSLFRKKKSIVIFPTW